MCIIQPGGWVTSTNTYVAYIRPIPGGRERSRFTTKMSGYLNKTNSRKQIAFDKLAPAKDCLDSINQFLSDGFLFSLKLKFDLGKYSSRGKVQIKRKIASSLMWQQHASSCQLSTHKKRRKQFWNINFNLPRATQMLRLNKELRIQNEKRTCLAQVLGIL